MERPLKHRRVLSLRSLEPLVEVFGVKINGVGGGDLYGKIVGNDGSYERNMYDRDSTNRQRISSRSGENILLLTGPLKVVSALDSFWIDGDLMHRDSSEEPEDKISVQMGRSSFVKRQDDYGEPEYEVIDGNTGKSATIFYAVFSDAVKAIVEVIINGAGPAGVYGLIAARNDMISGDDYESVLFRIAKEEIVREVRPGEPIPLSRTAVIVPRHWDLIVRADLYNQKNCNDFIQGIVSFPAKLSGTSHEKISDNFCNILVNVGWSDDCLYTP